MAGTLSISLQCIYSLPIQDTSTRPQCLVHVVEGVILPLGPTSIEQGLSRRVGIVRVPCLLKKTIS